MPRDYKAISKCYFFFFEKFYINSSHEGIIKPIGVNNGIKKQRINTAATAENQRCLYYNIHRRTCFWRGNVFGINWL